MKTLLKVFLVCGLGSLTGTLIAKELHYLWWIGMLAGGFLAYIGSDLKGAITAIPRAWNAVVSNRKEIAEAAAIMGVVFLIFGLLFLSVLLCVILVDNTSISKLIVASWVAIGLVHFFLKVFSTEVGAGVLSTKEVFLAILKNANPIAFHAYHAPAGTYKLLLFTVRFVKKYFIIIHSDFRLSCALDAAIGTSIGHFSGNNAIVGLIAGGIAGVMNYGFISRKLLRLEVKGV